jgi:hypothetical protein
MRQYLSGTKAALITTTNRLSGSNPRGANLADFCMMLVLIKNHTATNLEEFTRCWVRSPELTIIF